MTALPHGGGRQRHELSSGQELDGTPQEGDDPVAELPATAAWQVPAVLGWAPGGAGWWRLHRS